MAYFGLTLGSIRENCYIFYDKDSGKAAVIDPGADADTVLNALKRQNLTAAYILLTHGHYDHTGAADGVRAATGAVVMAYRDEEDLLIDPGKSYASSGAVIADSFLSDGDIINIGGKTLKTIHTPGHTAGSCCFYNEEEGVLFSGDTLFYESVGRYDLATGNVTALTRSIKDKLFTLPPETVVCPGHMEQTTIAHETAHNAFVR